MGQRIKLPPRPQFSKQPPGRPPIRIADDEGPGNEAALQKAADSYDEWIGGRAQKGGHDETNWLVSYADMMTLLVGFFVMLLSFSKIDAAQYERVKKATTQVFGGEYVIPFEQLSSKIKDVVDSKGFSKQVVFTETDRGIVINFRGSTFFDSGEAILKPKARDLLEKVIPVLSKEAKSFGVVIEGHTDNLPVNNKDFPSNWELSSVRACTVLRLFEERGFPTNRLKAIGWGDTRPILPNEDQAGTPIAENRAQNRRVVIKILREFEL